MTKQSQPLHAANCQAGLIGGGMCTCGAVLYQRPDPFDTGREELIAKLRAECARKDAALRDIREIESYRCAEKHGTAIIHTPGHELKCSHARHVLRCEEALKAADAGGVGVRKRARAGMGNVCTREL